MKHGRVIGMRRWKVIYAEGRGFDEIVTAAYVEFPGGGAVLFKTEDFELIAAIGPGCWFTVTPERPGDARRTLRPERG
jgi:hypothetical protein